MTEMRDKIAKMFMESSIRYYDDGPLREDDALEWADAVLALIEPVMEENKRLRLALQLAQQHVRTADGVVEVKIDLVLAKARAKSEKQDG
jgi:hypothetical protein